MKHDDSITGPIKGIIIMLYMTDTKYRDLWKEAKALQEHSSWSKWIDFSKGIEVEVEKGSRHTEITITLTSTNEETHQRIG